MASEARRTTRAVATFDPIPSRRVAADLAVEVSGGQAGYRFGDYWKLGLPLLGVTFLVAVFLVPVIWPF
jgi:hypothetical protein